MARKLLSTCFVTLWIGILLYFRNLSLPNLWIVLASAILWILMILITDRFKFKRLKETDYKIREFIDRNIGEKAVFFQLWFLGFLVFLLAYLALFPGIFGYDAPAQFAMYIGKLSLNSAQQPLLHTLFIGSVITLGKTIFGSYQAGFAFLVAVQGLLITNCMACVGIFLKRRNVPVLVILAGMIWVALNPCIQVLNCNVTKDVLFGVFFLYFLMAVTGAVEKEKAGYADVIKILVSGILMCLFRNGVVLAVFTCFIVCLLLRIKKGLIYGSLIAVMIITELFSFSAQQFWGIQKSPAKEYLSVPIQQLSYIMYLDENNPEKVNLSEVEREKLLEYIPEKEKLLMLFDSTIVDGPKAIFREDVFEENPIRFFTLYLNVLKRNAGVGFEAWTTLIQPYFNLNMNEYRLMMLYDLVLMSFEREEMDIHSSSLLPRYKEYLDETIKREMSFFVEPFVVFLILGLFIGRMILKKEKFFCPGVVAVLTYFAGILLGPVPLVRYVYPMMLAAPYFWGLLFKGNRYISEKAREDSLLEEIKNS